MNAQIEILETISTEERVRHENVTATVRTYTGKVTNISDGQVTGEDGQHLASFSQYEGSDLNVNFTSGCDKAAVITRIDNFIALVGE